MSDLPYTDRDRRILAAWKREMETLPDPVSEMGAVARCRRDAFRNNSKIGSSAEMDQHVEIFWRQFLPDAHAAIAANTAALRLAGLLREWLPIESAPQAEVCDFWLEWADDIAAHDGQKPLGQADWANEQRFRGHLGCWSSVYKATHWMPLPAAPPYPPDTAGI